MERRPLALRRRRRAEHLRGAGLVVADLGAADRHVIAQRFEKAQRAERDDVGGIFGDLERHLDMALCREVVDLVRLDLLEDAAQRRAVTEVAVVKAQRRSLHMRVVVDVIDAVGVEEAGAAQQPVDLVALAEEELRQIGAVLAGDSGDQRPFHDALTVVATPPRRAVRDSDRSRI